MGIKIAMIGAGAVTWTRTLLRDLLAVHEFADLTYSLTDISQRNLDMAYQLCRKDVEANRLPAKVEKATNRQAALKDADYVICAVRQGGLEAFRTDIDIPLKYGVDQCVGDTICAGGLMYAQRTIPALLDFCKDIRELSKPGAILLNYANPMAMNTWACNKYGKVPTIGLCHGVQGAHWQITSCIEHWAKREGIEIDDSVARHTDYASGHESRLNRREVDVTAAGLNHQTWFVKINWRGIDFIEDVGKIRMIQGKSVTVPSLLELFQSHPVFPQTERVRIDVLKRFGYYSTESNGHLSEYVPWYRKRTGEIKQWIDLSNWINGETGGYLRVCTEGRDWFETDFPNWLEEESPKIPGQRSEEHGSYIIESLETGRPYRGHFNIINHGHIGNLPECCIEIPGYVDRNGVSMPVVGDLPLACAATCSASARVQQMGMEAAVHGNLTLLKQAMLHDPLVGAVCNPEEVWQMTDELLVAQAEWLPQYAHEIEGAKTRLADHDRNGTRVRLAHTEGAARIQPKTVEEMSSDKARYRANAAASDKGKMTVSGTSAS